MKTTVYSIEGKKSKDLSLPNVFESRYAPELIKRAFTANQSETLQPKSNNILAGLRTTAEYIGRRAVYRSTINKAIARLPHVKTGGGGMGPVKRVPQAVGGRRVHPPKVNKTLVKEINKKESVAAMKSAIAATANRELIEARGHRIDGVTEFPIVFEDRLEAAKKTKDAVAMLAAVGLASDLARGRDVKVRAGKSTKRGKKYKTKKSVLVVVAKDARAFQNIPGVDVVTADKLAIDALAPGSRAGRLTVYTEAAIKRLGERYGN